jgi:hypothetical protein
MKLSDAFPSKYLTAEDIEEGDRTLTITAARGEVLGEGAKASNKIIISFREEKKELVCNKTNANPIAKIHGDDTDDWIGKQITLYATEVEYGGEVTLGIRVRLRAPAASAKAKAGPNAASCFTKFREMNPDMSLDDQKKAMRDLVAANFQGRTSDQLEPKDWAELDRHLDSLAALGAETVFTPEEVPF